MGILNILKEPKEEKSREIVDDNALDKADIMRRIRKIEMRLINLAKGQDKHDERISQAEDDIDTLWEAVFEEGEEHDEQRND